MLWLQTWISYSITQTEMKINDFSSLFSVFCEFVKYAFMCVFYIVMYLALRKPRPC